MNMRNSPSLLVLARASTLAISLAGTVVVARALGPAGRGQVASAFAFGTVLPVLISLGLPMLVRLRAASGDASQAIHTARQIAYATAPVCLVLSIGYQRLVMGDLSRWTSVAFSAACVSASLYLHALIDQSVLIAQIRYGRIAILQSMQVAASFFAIVALFVANEINVATVIAAQALGNTMTWWFGRISVGRVASRPTGEPVVRAALPYFGSAVLESTSLRIDQMLMLPVIGAVQAGLYSVAVTIAAIPLAVAHSIGTSAFRRVHAAGPNGGELGLRVVAGTFLLGLLTSVPLAASLQIAIPRVFGESFRPAVGPAWMALVGTPFLMANYVAMQALAALRSPRSMLLLPIAVVGACTVVFVPAGHWRGATGAAVAFSVAHATGTVVGIIALLRKGAPSPPGLRNSLAIAVSLLRSG